MLVRTLQLTRSVFIWISSKAQKANDNKTDFKGHAENSQRAVAQLFTHEKYFLSICDKASNYPQMKGNGTEFRKQTFRNRV